MRHAAVLMDVEKSHSVVPVDDDVRSIAVFAWKLFSYFSKLLKSICYSKAGLHWLDKTDDYKPDAKVVRTLLFYCFLEK